VARNLHAVIFAERLVARGHEVDVLTSCAHDYVDWADEYPAGTEVINGVTYSPFSGGGTT